MGNILGEPLSGTIKQQIAVRQRYYGDPTLDNNTEEISKKRILSNQNRNPFIRLSSSVNVTDKDILRRINLPENLDGSALAELFVLYNGTSWYDKESNTFGQRGGLNRSVDEPVITGAAYGLGGFSEFGNVPMPGIDSIDVKYKNRGSLREASVSLKCYSTDQFNIIDILYLRLGYTVLLEWGNSTYLNNKGVFENMETPIYYQDFIEGNYNYYEILNSIQRASLASQGNYDAFLGKITNFNWNFNPDGSYQITISLISIGDVIESIKTNQISYDIDNGALQNKIKELRKQIKELRAEAVQEWAYSLTNSALAGRYRVVGDGATFVDINNEVIVNEDTQDFNDLYLQGAANAQFDLANQSDQTNLAGTSYDPYAIDDQGNITGTVSGAVTNGFVGSRLQQILGTPSQELDDEGYIWYTWDLDKLADDGELGAAKKLLNELTSGVVDLDKSSAEYIYASAYLSNMGAILGQAINDFDKFDAWEMADKNNNYSIRQGYLGSSLEFVWAPYQFYDESIKGGVAQNHQYYVRLGTLLNLIEDFGVFKYINKAGDFEPCLKFDTTSANYITINNATLSGDPNVCIFAQDNYVFNSKAYSPYNFDGEPFVNSTDNSVGNLMNLYINIKYVLAKINEGNEKPEGTSLYDLLKHICNGINKSLGDVNKLEPIISEEKNTVRFIDQTPIAKEALNNLGYSQNFNPNSTAEFQIYGFQNTTDFGYVGSFVQKFKINSSITNKMATQLTIGAQAIGAAVSENASGLQYLNQGITDRIAPVKIDSVDIIDDDPETQIANINEKLEEQKGQMEELLQQLQSSILSQEDISNLKSLNGTFQNLYSTENSIRTKKPTSQGTGFIPINLSLTMDGLGGMKIYNTFTVNSKFLPVNYSNSLQFIITKISHKVDAGGWDTTIDSLVIPSSVAKIERDVSNARRVPRTIIEDTSELGIPNTEYRGPAGRYWSGEEEQFNERIPKSITLHITANVQSAQWNVEFVGRTRKEDDNDPANLVPVYSSERNGIHWAVDLKGNVAAGIPEEKYAIHGDNWNEHGIGIEISLLGGGDFNKKPKLPRDSNGDVDLTQDVDNDYAGIIKSGDWIDLGWTWQGYRYYQEYTDVQIAALETLIKQIMNRWPIIKTGVKGSVWNVFGITKPKAGDSFSNSNIRYGDTLVGDGEGEGYAKAGIWTHSTGKRDSHSDPIPTPKLIAMLVRLGYEDI